ncbi:type III-A CRISPR-associated RAMP protein Csm5 [Bacillota bacterium]
MKTGHLESHIIRLTTIGPVFVGAGYSSTKKEYLYDERHKKVYMLDFKKWMAYLEKRKLVDNYITFINSGERSLFQWCRQHRIEEGDFAEFVHYTMDAGDAILPNKPLIGIQQFIKNGKGEPYIPGSSLKGAIRTALLAKLVKEKGSGARHFRELKNAAELAGRDGRPLPPRRNEKLGKKTEEIENNHFHMLSFDPENEHNAVNSIMKAVSISDSEPFSVDRLVPCVKLDISKSGKENGLNLTRECIKPGTEIVFRLSLDTTLLKNTPLNINFIREAIKEFSDSYHKDYASKFTAVKECAAELDKPVIYLGGGAGFHSKTVISSLEEYNKTLRLTADLMARMFPDHHHDNDVRAGVSPHMIKFTKCNGQLLPFGKCSLVFE